MNGQQSSPLFSPFWPFDTSGNTIDLHPNLSCGSFGRSSCYSCEKSSGEAATKNRTHTTTIDATSTFSLYEILTDGTRPIISFSSVHDQSNSKTKDFSASGLKSLVEEHSIPESKIKITTSVVAFLWLYTSIQGDKPARVVVSSELPLASGLGSSVAYCVSLAGALIASSDSVNLDFSNEDWLSLGEKEQKLTKYLSF
ncbi:hypothetical protein L2E82_40242 [Cichorium intybus]|uniref:Uncharacterized protein n=1 Tax=Cichorium intybus TaxID=13427 RepID=A0ACB9AJQ4_CICIN|nr:hypothetical protein L2E82_40242 [Cichorium intybus]